MKELIARTAHNVNKAYCDAIGDTSQPEWEDAPTHIKNSAINGVEAHLANPDMTPQDSHANWMEQKEKDGFVYGEEKDLEAKTHPCMVPYEELPEAQRVKDYLFKGVVENFRHMNNDDIDELHMQQQNDMNREIMVLFGKIKTTVHAAPHTTNFGTRPDGLFDELLSVVNKAAEVFSEDAYSQVLGDLTEEFFKIPMQTTLKEQYAKKIQKLI